MAKLGLIFICVFLMVQISTSSRLVRSPEEKYSENMAFGNIISEVKKMMMDPRKGMQLSLAARIVRDAPDAPDATKPVSEEVNVFNLNEALSQLTQGIQKAFSKESVDKFMENLGETGEKFKEFGQGLIDRAQEKASELAHGKEEKQ